MTSLLFLINVSLAEECDVESYASTITSETGDATAEAFAKLAKCDAEKAKKYVKTTLPTFLPSEAGYGGAMAAVRIGAVAEVENWMKESLEPGERKRFFRVLGENCTNDEVVQKYFIDRATNTPEEFWKQRTYQYVTNCKVDSIQQIIAQQFEKGLDQGRSQYYALASATARIKEIASLEQLNKHLMETEDAETQVTMLAAMFEVIDEVKKVYPEDAKRHTEAQQQLVLLMDKAVPSLQPSAINRARSSYISLDEELKADELAGRMYEDLKQEDGTFLWGVIAVENATCKKGKLKQNIHSALVVEGGHTWIDQFEERVKAPAESAWVLNLAKKCKGESTVTWIVSDGPFADQASFEAWRTEQINSSVNAQVKKPKKLSHETIEL